MKSKVKVYAHVHHDNIVAFIEKGGVITCYTTEAETIPGLVYTSIPDWFPIAVVTVEADTLNQVLPQFEHVVTHKVTMDTLEKQFSKLTRIGNMLLQRSNDRALMNTGVEGGCEHVS